MLSKFICIPFICIRSIETRQVEELYVPCIVFFIQIIISDSAIYFIKNLICLFDLLWIELIYLCMDYSLIG